MKKIIILGLLVLLALAAIFFFVSRQSGAPGLGGVTGTLPAAVTSTPVAPATTSTSSATGFVPSVPSGGNFVLGTAQGSVTVNNFYAGAKISADGTSVLVAETPAYVISYYAPDSSFNILIEQMPFATVRAEAESAFLQKLGISEQDACKLKVQVGAPIGVDPSHAGQNLGLSFCAVGTFGQ